jgi:hypothetical protein
MVMVIVSVLSKKSCAGGRREALCCLHPHDDPGRRKSTDSGNVSGLVDTIPAAAGTPLKGRFAAVRTLVDTAPMDGLRRLI